MKKLVFVITLITLMCLTTVFSISCQNKADRLAKAKELLNKRCNKCHFSDKIYKKKYTRDDWENIIKRMVSLSKSGPKKDNIEITHEDAYEILLFLQEGSDD